MGRGSLNAKLYKKKGGENCPKYTADFEYSTGNGGGIWDIQIHSA
jgi:hypothetical protein